MIATETPMPGSLHPIVVPIPFTLPAVEQNNRNQKHTARESQPLSGSVHVESVPDEDGRALTTSRKTSITTEQGGTIYNIAPAQLAKAQAHWARKSAQRKQPGNCGRCGQPNPSKTHKYCDDCRDYAKRRREGKAGALVTVHQTAISWLERRIGALEHSLAMLQLNGRLMYKRGYSRGLKTGKEVRHYADTMPEISKQELAQISHAWDTEDAR
jgi:hypothetical protein